MLAKPLITVITLSFGLSACSFFSADKEDVAVSQLPKVTKAAAKTAHTDDVGKCSADGFCPLPLLKGKK